MMTRPRRAGSGASACIFFSRPVEARQRHLGDHLRPAAGLAVDGAMAAQERDPLVHAEQSDAFSWAWAILRAQRTKPPAPIAHLQPDKLVALFERDRHARSAGMLAHVGQRLLRDAEQRRLDLRRQTLIIQILVIGELPALTA